VVGWRTASATRAGRGRTFLGPIGSGALDSDGTIKSDTLDAVRTAAQDLVADSLGFGNGALVVYSPTHDIARDFTASAVRDQFAVLRSRRD
jgi:hypothetical protein